MNTSHIVQPAVERPQPASLSWPAFSAALIALLAIFVLFNPIWEQSDMNSWNQNIWWSYLAIPFVIGGLLKLERKFSWTALGFEVMKMTFVKFVLTYVIAHAIWETRGFPGTGRDEVRATTDSTRDAYDLCTVPPASSIKSDQLGRLSGVLLGPAGAPAAQVLVYVYKGLSRWTFDPPAEPVILRNATAGFEPSVSVLQTHQVLALQSSAAALHTGVFSAAGGHSLLRHRLLNYPVIPGGERRLMFEHEEGWLELSCSVHGHAEPRAQVLVLGHPFWTRTDSEGRFDLRDVPAGDLELMAWGGPGQSASQTVTLAPGGTSDMSLRLAPVPPVEVSGH